MGGTDGDFTHVPRLLNIGMIRIMANPNYHPVKKRLPFELLSALRGFARNRDHDFWPDEVSFRDTASLESERILGSCQVTDLYLLGLAVQNGVRYVTFKESINLAAVAGASPAKLIVIR